jgi:hypothetical protein
LLGCNVDTAPRPGDERPGLACLVGLFDWAAGAGGSGTLARRAMLPHALSGKSALVVVDTWLEHCQPFP